jgi:hypothetical protein
MKKIVSVQEVDGEGLVGLMGEVVMVFCLNYIYTGTLSGVNDTCILLDNPSIVYETGDFSKTTFTDAQKMPNQIYIQTSAIESFGKTNKR